MDGILSEECCRLVADNSGDVDAVKAHEIGYVFAVQACRSDVFFPYSEGAVIRAGLLRLCKSLTGYAEERQQMFVVVFLCYVEEHRPRAVGIV